MRSVLALLVGTAIVVGIGCTELRLHHLMFIGPTPCKKEYPNTCVVDKGKKGRYLAQYQPPGEKRGAGGIVVVENMRPCKPCPGMQITERAQANEYYVRCDDAQPTRADVLDANNNQVQNISASTGSQISWEGVGTNPELKIQFSGPSACSNVSQPEKGTVMCTANGRPGTYTVNLTAQEGTCSQNGLTVNSAQGR